ncbi:MAG: DUF4432 family protein [Defluviitaleaceae bacterium]|nr:DUF4432 family protein [Defluviitaleaceae bacterium]
MSTKINLYPHFFTEKERIISEAGELRASCFKYDSGVAALRVTNKRGEIIVLPYQGQQIWHVTFDDRPLHMKSIFEEPVDTQDYFSTYGGFFLHCGVTAVGVPGLGDTHPLHGELPNVRYQEAYLTHGQDEQGCYITIGGGYTHKAALNHHYMAEPTIKMYEDSPILDVSMKITNLLHRPMEVMYLGHINFRPVDYAELMYSAPYDSEHVVVNVNVPTHIKSGACMKDLLAYLQKVKETPALHHIIDPSAPYDPEGVMFIKYHADKDGLAHTLQVHPDGYAHYATHRPDQMDNVIRWIARTPDHDAMGMVLPLNSGPGGYSAEKAAGNIKTLAPGAKMHFDMQMGLLEPGLVDRVKQKIEDVKNVI